MLMPQGALTIDLPATDADGNPLSYTTQLSAPANAPSTSISSSACRTWAATTPTSKATASVGCKERRVSTSCCPTASCAVGGTRVFVRPGRSRRHASTPVYYANPSKLWDAKPAPTATVIGHQLNLTAAPPTPAASPSM